ncbi:CotO family spore coat protein [Bacillus sp. C28GYM-DRY-1]|nr:CotO family spore coat protein [Bacillus sp. C28GYM-DRY-1]MDO3660091.1 CotO family spore coat protein [Bacillus sp. C28GYM-DRY-1]
MKISEGKQRRSVGKEDKRIQELTKKQEDKLQTSNNMDDHSHHTKNSETNNQESSHKSERSESNGADLIKGDEKNIKGPETKAEHPEKQPEAVHNIKADEKAVSHKRIKKPMSKMSIHEKIDFLTKLPHNMPRALCLIESKGKTYRGVIVGRRNNSVLVRTTGNGAPTELLIDDITSLHPLGF